MKRAYNTAAGWPVRRRSERDARFIDLTAVDDGWQAEERPVRGAEKRPGREADEVEQRRIVNGDEVEGAEVRDAGDVDVYHRFDARISDN